MRRAAILVRENDCAFILEDGPTRYTGIFPETEAEAFFAEHRPHEVHLILAKPRLYWRRISFPFARRRNVELALPAELEDLLPGPVDSFLCDWDVSRTADSSGAEVRVAAWENAAAERWFALARQHRFRLLVTADMFVVHSVARQFVPEDSCFIVYSDDAYAMVIEQKDRAISSVYSSWGSASLSDLLSAVAPGNSAAVYWMGAQPPVEISATQVPGIASPPDGKPCFLLPAARLSRTLRKRSLRLRPVRVRSQSTLQAVGIAAALAVALIGACSPYLQIPAHRRAVDALDRRMRETFSRACPDVTVIKDPLSQIQERLRNAESRQTGLPPRIEALRTMSDFVRAVPDDLLVEVNEFVLTGISVVIAGKVENIKAADRLRVHLEKSGRFQDVHVGDLSFDADRTVLFNIIAKVTEQ